MRRPIAREHVVAALVHADVERRPTVRGNGVDRPDDRRLVGACGEGNVAARRGAAEAAHADAVNAGRSDSTVVVEHVDERVGRRLRPTQSGEGAFGGVHASRPVDDHDEVDRADPAVFGVHVGRRGGRDVDEADRRCQQRRDGEDGQEPSHDEVAVCHRLGSRSDDHVSFSVYLSENSCSVICWQCGCSDQRLRGWALARVRSGIGEVRVGCRPPSECPLSRQPLGRSAGQISGGAPPRRPPSPATHRRRWPAGSGLALACWAPRRSRCRAAAAQGSDCHRRPSRAATPESTGCSRWGLAWCRCGCRCRRRRRR